MTNYPFLQIHLVILLTGKYNLLELTTYSPIYKNEQVNMS